MEGIMQLAQQIKMRQSQSLVMTPQLQQAIKLLQMTNIELCQYLENQQSENPFLEIETSIDNKSKSDEENKNENITSNISDDFKNGNNLNIKQYIFSDFMPNIFDKSNILGNI